MPYWPHCFGRIPGHGWLSGMQEHIAGPYPDFHPPMCQILDKDKKNTEKLLFAPVFWYFIRVHYLLCLTTLQPFSVGTKAIFELQTNNTEGKKICRAEMKKKYYLSIYNETVTLFKCKLKSLEILLKSFFLWTFVTKSLYFFHKLLSSASIENIYKLDNFVLPFFFKKPGS